MANVQAGKFYTYNGETNAMGVMEFSNGDTVFVLGIDAQDGHAIIANHHAIGGLRRVGNEALVPTEATYEEAGAIKAMLDNRDAQIMIPLWRQHCKDDFTTDLSKGFEA